MESRRRELAECLGARVHLSSLVFWELSCRHQNRRLFLVPAWARASESLDRYQVSAWARASESLDRYQVSAWGLVRLTVKRECPDLEDCEVCHRCKDLLEIHLPRQACLVSDHEVHYSARTGAEKESLYHQGP